MASIDLVRVPAPAVVVIARGPVRSRVSVMVEWLVVAPVVGVVVGRVSSPAGIVPAVRAPRVAVAIVVVVIAHVKVAVDAVVVAAAIAVLRRIVAGGVVPSPVQGIVHAGTQEKEGRQGGKEGEKKALHVGLDRGVRPAIREKMSQGAGIDSPKGRRGGSAPEMVDLPKPCPDRGTASPALAPRYGLRRPNWPENGMKLQCGYKTLN